jgi:transposase
MEPGASVAEVAGEHDLNANMVFQWRGDPRFGPGREAMSFLPVEVHDDPVPAPVEPAGGCGSGRIEIALASGHRLVFSGGVDVDVILRLARGLCGP